MIDAAISQLARQRVFSCSRGIWEYFHCSFPDAGW